MNDLSAKEEDLLQRVQEKPELASRFFRQAKSLKWFYRLKEAGFFDPSNLSGPQPVENTEGHVQIPNWPPIEYLLNCVGAAATEGNEDYAREFLGIIEGVTMHAQENSVENYQVWWRFAEILSSLPFNLVEPKHVMLTEHWCIFRPIMNTHSGPT
ncbi:MAG: hypothetical protein RPU15_09615 [Candidatus Sedimenticola sp. (ex Thyasira tokunagai)]